MAARDGVSTAFPTLVPASADKLGFLAFSGDMTGSNFKYGTVGGPNTTRAAAASSADAPGLCRLTKNTTDVHTSGDGCVCTKLNGDPVEMGC
jgi:hypothetical protein